MPFSHLSYPYHGFGRESGFCFGKYLSLVHCCKYPVHTEDFPSTIVSLMDVPTHNAQVAGAVF